MDHGGALLVSCLGQPGDSTGDNYNQEVTQTLTAQLKMLHTLLKVWVFVKWIWDRKDCAGVNRQEAQHMCQSNENRCVRHQSFAECCVWCGWLVECGSEVHEGANTALGRALVSVCTAGGVVRAWCLC